MSNRLDDLIDIRAFQRLIDEYCASAGITAGIVDLDGKVLIGPVESRICALFHEPDPQNCRHCIENLLETPLQESEQFTTFSCPNGLGLAVAPIAVDGQLQARIFCGPYLLQPLAPEFIRTQAARNGFTEQEYRTALNQVPVLTPDRIRAILKFLIDLVETNIALGLSRQRLAQSEEKQEICRISLVEDITDLNQAKEALQKSERKYRELVENANNIILRWDREGRITFMNEFGLAFFGYAEPELLGRNVMDTIVPETEITGRDLRPLIAQIIAAPQDFEHNINQNIRRDGTRVWIAWTNKVLMDDAGQISGVLSIGTDVSELKRMEECLREADRRKDEFLLMLSHELRNPLAPIRNAVAVLRRVGPNDPAQKRQQDIIERQLKHFSRLIDDLLDVARFTRGIINLNLETLNLREIIEQAIDNVMILNAARKDDFTCELPPQDMLVRGDSTRLVQVFCNLLDNSMKYSSLGQRITLRARLEPALAPDRGPDAVILVEDEGAGIAPEILPHVFELFVQADKSLARTIGGLGIGLTLVRRIVELHGGSIVAHSPGPNQGSSFCIRIPALIDANAPRSSNEKTNPQKSLFSMF